MFGSEVNLDLLANASRFLRFKGLVERGEAMCVQVVHHEHDFLCVWIMDIDEFTEHLCEIVFRAMGADRHVPLASQRFKAQEKTTHALSLIFVVKTLHLPWRSRHRETCFAHELFAGFIQAHEAR